MGCDIHPYAEIRTDGRWRPVEVKLPCDRNYVAFGVLANQRNGFGFAGVDTGDAVTPIAEPRGLPLNIATHETPDADWNNGCYVWFGDHSFSWVTLAELLALDLKVPVTQRGMVTEAIAAEMRDTGKPPRAWCGGTTAKGYEKVEWQRPLGEAARLLPELIDALAKLGDYDPNDVRIVFGFDS